MGFLNEHKKNIINEKVTGINQLEPGHIIRFNYRGKEVHTPRPLVLVLNPSWYGSLHCVKLDAVPEDALQKLYHIVKETRADKLKKLLRLRLSILSPVIGNPEKFYNTKIRPWMERNFKIGENPYRTYKRKGISGVRLIDYRFKDYYTGDESTSEKK